MCRLQPAWLLEECHILSEAPKEGKLGETSHAWADCEWQEPGIMDPRVPLSCAESLNISLTEPWLTMNVESQLFGFLIHMRATYLVLNTWLSKLYSEAMLVTEVSEKTLKNYESILMHCKLCCPNPKMNTFSTLGRDNVGHEFGNREWREARQSKKQLYLYGSDSVLGPRFQTQT